MFALKRNKLQGPICVSARGQGGHISPPLHRLSLFNAETVLDKKAMEADSLRIAFAINSFRLEVLKPP